MVRADRNAEYSPLKETLSDDDDNDERLLYRKAANNAIVVVPKEPRGFNDDNDSAETTPFPRSRLASIARRHKVSSTSGCCRLCTCLLILLFAIVGFALILVPLSSRQVNMESLQHMVSLRALNRFMMGRGSNGGETCAIKHKLLWQKRFDGQHPLLIDSSNAPIILFASDAEKMRLAAVTRDGVKMSDSSFTIKGQPLPNRLQCVFANSSSSPMPDYCIVGGSDGSLSRFRPHARRLDWSTRVVMPPAPRGCELQVHAPLVGLIDANGDGREELLHVTSVECGDKVSELFSLVLLSGSDGSSLGQAFGYRSPFQLLARPVIESNRLALVIRHRHTERTLLISVAMLPLFLAMHGGDRHKLKLALRLHGRRIATLDESLLPIRGVLAADMTNDGDNDYVVKSDGSSSSLRAIDGRGGHSIWSRAQVLSAGVQRSVLLHSDGMGIIVEYQCPLAECRHPNRHSSHPCHVSVTEQRNGHTVWHRNATTCDARPILTQRHLLLLEQDMPTTFGEPMRVKRSDMSDELFLDEKPKQSKMAEKKLLSESDFLSDLLARNHVFVMDDDEQTKPARLITTPPTSPIASMTLKSTTLPPNVATHAQSDASNRLEAQSRRSSTQTAEHDPVKTLSMSREVHVSTRIPGGSTSGSTMTTITSDSTIVARTSRKGLLMIVRRSSNGFVDKQIILRRHLPVPVPAAQIVADDAAQAPVHPGPVRDGTNYSDDDDDAPLVFDLSDATGPDARLVVVSTGKHSTLVEAYLLVNAFSCDN